MSIVKMSIVSDRCRWPDMDAIPGIDVGDGSPER
jgi:hypothetical protein